MKSGHKNLLITVGEWWEQRQIARRAVCDGDVAPSRHTLLQRIGRWFLPNGGTLLLIAVLILTQNVWAGPALRNLAAESAASTGTIAYQGRLADANGAPITNTVNMVFRLYAASTGGAPLWSEQWTGSNAVQVSDGLFNVMLGSLTPIAQSVITGNGTLFLGITVGTDDEMVPRVQLGSVPFAVQALTVPDGSVTTAKIADGAVTQAKLDNTIQSSFNASILEWNDNTYQSFSATGADSTRLTMPTTIQIAIPANETHVFAVFYRGNFNYDYNARSDNQTGFYALWSIALLSNNIELVSWPHIIQTGYQTQWSAVGGNWYWNYPFGASGLIELDPGTHSLQVRISGYSAGTMSTGNLGDQRLQVVQLH